MCYFHVDRILPSHPVALHNTLALTTQENSWCKRPSPGSGSMLHFNTTHSFSALSSNVLFQILKSHPYLDLKSISCNLNAIQILFFSHAFCSVTTHCFPALASETQNSQTCVSQGLSTTNTTGFITRVLQAWGCHRDVIQTPSVCQALKGKC